MLIGDILAEAAARVPDRPAIVVGSRTQTYGELEASSNRVANALVREGLGRGHHVAIYAINCNDYAAVYFGAAKAGSVLAHLSARFSVDELRGVIARTDIGAVFVHPDLVETLLGLRDQLPGLERVILLGDGTAADTESLADFLGPAPEVAPVVALAETDPFAITFTGGTTGFPKGVVVSHESRVIGSVRAAREFGLRSDDVFCCSTPLFHIAGLFVWFQTGIMMGCPCVLMPAWDAQAFMELVEHGGVTASFLVPTQINSILSHPEFSARRLENWRYGNFGGSPTPVALLERMRKLLPHVVWVDQYGQSEAGNLTVRPPEFIASKPDSVGRPYEDVELAIFDAGDNPLPPGEPGEVVTRGVHLMLGYYNDPEQTQEVVTESGWLKTGDIGYLDEEGFLYLVDRSKDVIISGGENLFPMEIENALYQHDAVNECAVFGVPDDHWGELPAAHVVLRHGASVTEEELIDFCAERIARHKRPRRIRFVEELPKTAVGKIQKNVIRRPYWAGRERRI